MDKYIRLDSFNQYNISTTPPPRHPPERKSNKIDNTTLISITIDLTLEYNFDNLDVNASGYWFVDSAFNLNFDLAFALSIY